MYLCFCSIPFVRGYRSEGGIIDVFVYLEDDDDTGEHLLDELCYITRRPRHKFRIKSHHQQPGSE